MQSLEDLLTKLDGEYSWRLKELISMKSLIYQEEKEKSKIFTLTSSIYQEEIEKSKIFIRTSLVFLYAHWEGFVRKATEYYLDYINDQGHNYGELNQNLIALALKNKGMQLDQNSDNIDRYYEAVSFVLNRSSFQVKLSSSKVIKDTSILNSKQFKNLLRILGLSAKHYELKEKKLDEILIKKRNNIAHGKHNYVNLEDFEFVYEMVVDFLNYFKDQIFDSAQHVQYLNIADFHQL